MRGDTTDCTTEPDADRLLPDWLKTYTRYGLYGLVVGTILCLASLVTNAVPDPSFPWFSVPGAYRLPITQPRIEHWPVSYTIGVWLWIACAPALFLRGYERFSERWRLSPATWLVGLPTLGMIMLTTYCRLFWPKPTPATWNAPAYTVVCWAYCATYDLLWSNLAYVIAGIGVVAVILAGRRSSLAVATETVFGVLALPLGLPVLFDAYRRTIATRS